MRAEQRHLHRSPTFPSLIPATLPVSQSHWLLHLQTMAAASISSFFLLSLVTYIHIKYQEFFSSQNEKTQNWFFVSYSLSSVPLCSTHVSHMLEFWLLLHCPPYELNFRGWLLRLS